MKSRNAIASAIIMTSIFICPKDSSAEPKGKVVWEGYFVDGLGKHSLLITDWGGPLPFASASCTQEPIRHLETSSSETFREQVIITCSTGLTTKVAFGQSCYRYKRDHNQAVMQVDNGYLKQFIIAVGCHQE